MNIDKSNLPPFKVLLDYELIGSWWACNISWGWAQAIVARYFVWKTTRKYNRYEKFMEMREKIKTL